MVDLLLKAGPRHDYEMIMTRLQPTTTEKSKIKSP